MKKFSIQKQPFNIRISVCNAHFCLEFNSSYFDVSEFSLKCWFLLKIQLNLTNSVFMNFVDIPLVFYEIQFTLTYFMEMNFVADIPSIHSCV